MKVSFITGLQENETEFQNKKIINKIQIHQPKEKHNFIKFTKVI
jgi:hypothetical protein